MTTNYCQQNIAAILLQISYVIQSDVMLQKQVLSNFLFLFSNKLLNIRAEIHKMLVRTENKKAKIRNQYNQAPHPTQDTTWESDKQENITYKRAKR